MAKTLPPSDYLILHSYNTIAEIRVNYNCSIGVSDQLLYTTRPFESIIPFIDRRDDFLQFFTA